MGLEPGYPALQYRFGDAEFIGQIAVDDATPLIATHRRQFESFVVLHKIPKVGVQLLGCSSSASPRCCHRQRCNCPSRPSTNATSSALSAPLALAWRKASMASAGRCKAW